MAPACFVDLSSLSWPKTETFLPDYFYATLVSRARSARERGLQSAELVQGGRRESGNTHFWLQQTIRSDQDISLFTLDIVFPVAIAA